MASKGLVKLFEKLTIEVLVKILVAIVIVAMVAAVFPTVIYFWEFRGPLSSDQGTWGSFGEYFGGVLSPLLSFLALIVLVFTLFLQGRQLEYAREEAKNSRSELEATQEQLERSADAQIATVSALTDQAKHAAASARLSALSAGLNVLSETVKRNQGPRGWISSSTQEELLEQQQRMEAEIMKITSELLKNK